MSRPLRIEYPNAVYHVMNRGQGRSNIFHGKAYTDAFLTVLAEAHQQFGLEILAYCLMNNHYHLLVRTPRANLSRCMRHVNGVYTQRYNKLRRTDGALFRGRYKAILVEEDEYLLPVSRYIHRNPVVTRKPMVKQLKDYTLSSYPAYINQVETPSWLNKRFILGCMNIRQSTRAYKNYVLDGNDVTLTDFYQKKHLPSVLGNKHFIAEVKKHAVAMDGEVSGQHVLNTLKPNDIVRLVGKAFSLTLKQIKISAKGVKEKNHPRQIAMLLCKRYSGLTLPVLAEYFNVKNYSTVSKQAQRLLEDVETEPSLARQVAVLEKQVEERVMSGVKI